MAREHGRIQASAWREDEDWKALTVDAQWCYMMLLSQGDLTLAGVVSVSRRRWMKYAADLDVDRLGSGLALLVERRFVVLDEDAEELLVRSFARRETQWANPKRRNGLVSAAKVITSSEIRNALRVELARVNRDLEGREISTNRLVEALPENSANGLTENDPDISGNRSGNRLVDVSRLPSPVSNVASVDTQVWDDETADEPDDPTGRLLAEHANAYGEPVPPSTLVPVKIAIQQLVGERVSEDRIRAALERMRSKKVHPKLLPTLLAEVTATSDVTRGAGFWNRRG